MGEHDALRGAGGSRGVQQAGHVIGLDAGWVGQRRLVQGVRDRMDRQTAKPVALELPAHDDPLERVVRHVEQP